MLSITIKQKIHLVRLQSSRVFCLPTTGNVTTINKEDTYSPTCSACSTLMNWLVEQIDRQTECYIVQSPAIVSPLQNGLIRQLPGWFDLTKYLVVRLFWLSPIQVFNVTSLHALDVSLLSRLIQIKGSSSSCQKGLHRVLMICLLESSVSEHILNMQGSGLVGQWASLTFHSVVICPWRSHQGWGAPGVIQVAFSLVEMVSSFKIQWGIKIFIFDLEELCLYFYILWTGKDRFFLLYNVLMLKAVMIPAPCSWEIHACFFPTLCLCLSPPLIS